MLIMNESANTLDNANINNPTASPTENTTYTVMGEGSCGSGTVTVTISIDDFTFSLGPDVGFCEGMNNVFVASGSEPTSYLWNTNETTQIINVTSEGLYSCTVTSPNGCSYTDEVNAMSSFIPTIEFYTPNDSACPPASFQRDSTLAQSDDPIVVLNWTIAGQQSNTPATAIAIDSGSYDVTLEVVTELGCRSSLTIPNYLIVHETPKTDFSVQPLELSHCNTTVDTAIY